MAKRTPKASQARTLSADRLRTGWEGPAGTRIRLARQKDVEEIAALLDLVGDDVRLEPDLRAAIEDRSIAAAIRTGLDAASAPHVAVRHSFTARPVEEAAVSVCLPLVAIDEENRVVGVLSVTAPGTIIETAAQHGWPIPEAMALSLTVAKAHGLAVTEDARGRGIGSALLDRAWQIYQQLGYALLYGSFEASRDLESFYTRCGFTVHAPGEPLVLSPIGLGFGFRPGDTHRMITRWRPNT